MAGLTTSPADTGTLTLAALPSGLPPRFVDKLSRIEIGLLYSDPAAVSMCRTFASDWMPGTWFVQDFRHDDQGRQWHRAYAAVVDDFGTLVEVAS